MRTWSVFEIVTEPDANQTFADLSRQNVCLAQPYPRIGRANGRLERSSCKRNRQCMGGMMYALEVQKGVASNVA